MALFRNWEAFARLSNEHPGTSKTFGGNLGKRGFPSTKKNGIRAHRGIALKPIEEEFDGPGGY